VYVTGALTVQRLTTLAAHKTRHVPVTADRRQIVPVADRHHTPGTDPAAADRAVLVQPEVVLVDGTSGVQVTWTQVGQRRRHVVLELVEE